MVSVEDMSGVTISTGGDFSEGETLLCDTGCGCALLLRASLFVVCWLVTYNPTFL